MADQTMIRYGGIATIIGSVLYISTFLTGGTVFYGIFGLAGVIVMASAYWGLYVHYSQDNESILVKLSLVALILGGLFISGLYFIALVGVILGDALPGIQEFGLAVAQVSIIFGNVWFVGTFLLALAGLRSGKDPAWLAWMGLVGSVVAWGWFGFGWLGPLFDFIPAFGFLLTLIWLIIVGVRMVRSSSQ